MFGLFGRNEVMIRLLTILLVLLFATPVLVGCTEESSTQASELGIQEGRRPVKAEKRPPPGPRDGTFQEGAEEDQDTSTTSDDD